MYEPEYEPTLMYKLVEGVLAVGPRLAPGYGSGLVGHSLTAAGDVFTVRLHVALLEVRRETMHVLRGWTVCEQRSIVKFDYLKDYQTGYPL